MSYRLLVFSLLLAIMPGQSFAQPAPVETVEGDHQWEVDITNGACSRLRDRLTDPPALVAACHATNASQPPCMVYKGYAQIWFDMHQTRDPILSYQPQMISNLGAGNDEVLADRSPEFRGRLQRLLAATLSADLGQWKTPDKWASFAYSRCMAGQFL